MTMSRNPHSGETDARRGVSATVCPHGALDERAPSCFTALKSGGGIQMARDGAYDAVIVGSGGGGAMAAYVLTKAGAKALILEAGRNYDPEEAPMLNYSQDAPLRGTGTPDKPFGFYDATVDGGWEVPGEPYTTAEGSEFTWW